MRHRHARSVSNCVAHMDELYNSIADSFCESVAHVSVSFLKIRTLHFVDEKVSLKLLRIKKETKN